MAVSLFLWSISALVQSAWDPSHLNNRVRSTHTRIIFRAFGFMPCSSHQKEDKSYLPLFKIPFVFSLLFTFPHPSFWKPSQSSIPSPYLPCSGKYLAASWLPQGGEVARFIATRQPEPFSCLGWEWTGTANTFISACYVTNTFETFFSPNVPFSQKTRKLYLAFKIPIDRTLSMVGTYVSCVTMSPTHRLSLTYLQTMPHSALKRDSKMGYYLFTYCNIYFFFFAIGMKKLNTWGKSEYSDNFTNLS